MASAEYGIMYMHNYPEKVGEYVDNLQIFRGKCGQLKHIHLLSEKDLACFDYDKGKLVFCVKNTEMDGKKLFQILLSEYNLELEMVTCSYGIAMTSVCDEKEDFDYLFDALYEIDLNLDKSERNKDFLAEKSAYEKEKPKCFSAAAETNAILTYEKPAFCFSHAAVTNRKLFFRCRTSLQVRSTGRRTLKRCTKR